MNVKIKYHLYLLILVFLLITGSCKQKLPVTIYRFEQKLFAIKEPKAIEQLKVLSIKDSIFFKNYAEDMLSISADESEQFYAPSLLKFINHPSIKQLKKEVDSVFPDIHFIENKIG